MTETPSFRQELVSLFGQPVAENPTQLMIESAFRHHGLDWRYLTIEVDPEHLGDAVRGMRAMGFRGGNCTIPHKVAVIRHLDRLGASASLMGAVNCIVRRGAELVGENTDGKGFLASLREIADPRGLDIAILGAGGAARAIAVELALAGAKRITIVNRSSSRGEELVRLLREKVAVAADFVSWSGDWRIPASVQVVVQATSIGLFPDVEARVPLVPASLRSDLIVADVIPNPPATRLVRDARERGCKVIDGLGMLVQQGVIGFEYWTGIQPEAAVMREALESVFGRSS
jgi:shikimate dehydrogenase